MVFIHLIHNQSSLRHHRIFCCLEFVCLSFTHLTLNTLAIKIIASLLFPKTVTIPQGEAEGNSYIERDNKLATIL